jgi:hypothetical protein
MCTWIDSAIVRHVGETLEVSAVPEADVRLGLAPVGDTVVLSGSKRKWRLEPGAFLAELPCFAEGIVVASVPWSVEQRARRPENVSGQSQLRFSFSPG